MDMSTGQAGITISWEKKDLKKSTEIIDPIPRKYQDTKEIFS